MVVVSVLVFVECAHTRRSGGSPTPDWHPQCISPSGTPPSLGARGSAGSAAPRPDPGGFSCRSVRCWHPRNPGRPTKGRAIDGLGGGATSLSSPLLSPCALERGQRAARAVLEPGATAPRPRRLEALLPRTVGPAWCGRAVARIAWRGDEAPPSRGATNGTSLDRPRRTPFLLGVRSSRRRGYQ